MPMLGRLPITNGLSPVRDFHSDREACHHKKGTTERIGIAMTILALALCRSPVRFVVD